VNQINALGDKFSSKKLIEEIQSFNISSNTLSEEFGLSDTALRNYRQQDQAPVQRLSAPLSKLVMLHLSLNHVKDRGYADAFTVIKNLSIDETPFLSYISNNATEKLLQNVLEQTIKLEVPFKSAVKPLDKFREKYDHLNDDTLSIATQDDPELLLELIDDTSLRPSTRGDIIQALAIGARNKYLPTIKDQLNNTAPHLREAAIIGLYEYYDSGDKYSYLKDLFKDKLSNETAEGVKRTITELLEEM